MIPNEMKGLFLIILIFFSYCLVAQETIILPNSISIDTASWSDPVSPKSLIGMDAPRFRAKTIEGAAIDIDSMEGKIIVLNFWFVGCGPCRKEIPMLNELAEHNKARNDVRFIAISNVDSEKVLAYVQQRLGFKYELIAKAQHIADAYHINLYPTNLVIDKSGKVTFVEVGYQADIKDRIQHVIDSLP